MASYYPASFTIVDSNGTLDFGDWTKLQADDADRVGINEVSDAPGFDIIWDFNGLPANIGSFGIRVNGYYVGNPAHIVTVWAYNYTQGIWQRLTSAANDMPSSGGDQDYLWMVPGTDFVSAGNFRFRIIHSSSGNPNHDLLIDRMAIDDTVSTTSTTTTTTTSSTSSTSSTISTTSTTSTTSTSTTTTSSTISTTSTSTTTTSTTHTTTTTTTGPPPIPPHCGFERESITVGFERESVTVGFEHPCTH